MRISFSGLKGTSPRNPPKKWGPPKLCSHTQKGTYFWQNFNDASSLGRSVNLILCQRACSPLDGCLVNVRVPVKHGVSPKIRGFPFGFALNQPQTGTLSNRRILITIRLFPSLSEELSVCSLLHVGATGDLSNLRFRVQVFVKMGFGPSLGWLTANPSILGDRFLL